MAIQTINNGESGSAVRNKLNSNFNELAASASIVGPPTLPTIANSAAMAPGVVVESAAVTVSGSASTVWPAVVRGDGTPEVQVNEGPWAQSAIFRAGDTLKLRNVSPPVGLNYVATIYAASFSSNWVLGFDPSFLFAAGEQGVWYDPSDMSTMFQDAAGTTPVTAVEQPVGRILDKSGRGNHATQPTATARPVLSARVNLLTKTEDFGDAVWTATGDGAYTVSKTATAPNGTPNDAFVITFTAGTFAGFAQNLGGVWPSSTVALCRIHMRSPLRNITVKLSCQGSDAVGALTCNLTATWQEFTVPPSDVSGKLRYALICNDRFLAGDVVEVWHPQAETGSTSNPYQRVNTATDYDTAGFPHRLKFDGIDDVTNTTFAFALGSNCTVARAVVGGPLVILTGQTISTSYADTTDHAGLIIVNRALTPAETASLTNYLTAKGAS